MRARIHMRRPATGFDNVGARVEQADAMSWLRGSTWKFRQDPTFAAAFDVSFAGAKAKAVRSEIVYLLETQASSEASWLG